MSAFGTLAFSSAVSLLSVAFGRQALVAGRALREPSPAFSLGWTVVGVGFVMAGACSIVSSVLAAWAVAAGEQSSIYHAVVRWMPAGNYSRTWLKACLALLLCLLPVLSRLPRRRAIAYSAGWLALFFVLGGAFGWREGPLRVAVHFPSYAMFETVELLLLLSALLVGVVWNTMDRVLWSVIGIYAARQALNALSYIALSWFGVPGMWNPGAAHVQVIGVVGYVVMLALTEYRRRLAARGVEVTGMIQSARAPAPLLY